jgi:hypothetical protein
MPSLIFLGAGGFGLEVAAYAEDSVRAGTARYEVKGFLDDLRLVGDRHAGLPILGNTDADVDLDALYVVSVGSPQGRKILAEKFKAKGATFVTLVHPASYVAKDASVGPGSVLAPFSFVGPSAKVGEHCLINVHAVVGHELAITACFRLAQTCLDWPQLIRRPLWATLLA